MHVSGSLGRSEVHEPTLLVEARVGRAGAGVVRPLYTCLVRRKRDRADYWFTYAARGRGTLWVLFLCLSQSNFLANSIVLKRIG